MESQAIAKSVVNPAGLTRRLGSLNHCYVSSTKGKETEAKKVGDLLV